MWCSVKCTVRCTVRCQEGGCSTNNLQVTVSRRLPSACCRLDCPPHSVHRVFYQMYCQIPGGSLQYKESPDYCVKTSSIIVLPYGLSTSLCTPCILSDVLSDAKREIAVHRISGALRHDISHLFFALWAVHLTLYDVWCAVDCQKGVAVHTISKKLRHDSFHVRVSVLIVHCGLNNGVWYLIAVYILRLGGEGCSCKT
jgi:hypothetical protein